MKVTPWSFLLRLFFIGDVCVSVRYRYVHVYGEESDTYLHVSRVLEEHKMFQDRGCEEQTLDSAPYLPSCWLNKLFFGFP